MSLDATAMKWAFNGQSIWAVLLGLMGRALPPPLLLLARPLQVPLLTAGLPSAQTIFCAECSAGRAQLALDELLLHCHGRLAPCVSNDTLSQLQAECLCCWCAWAKLWEAVAGAVRQVKIGIKTSWHRQRNLFSAM